MLLTGVVAGFAGSMLGLGGGFVLVPLLTALYGIGYLKNVVVASLSAIVLTSLISTLRYKDLGLLKEDLTALFSIPTVIGAILGSLTLRIIKPKTLSIIFGLAILLVIFTMAFRKREVVTHKGPVVVKPYTYPIFVLSGFASNLLGIGGGLINVPALTLLCRLGLKSAIAVSTSLMCYSTVIGVTNGYVSGLFMPQLAIPAALGVSIGAYLGPLATAKLPTATLRKVFIAAATYLALRMVLRGLGVYVP